VVTASKDGKARLWAMNNNLLDSVFNVSESGLISANYSPDGTRLVAVSSDGKAEILALLPEIQSLVAHLWLSHSCPGPETRNGLLGQPMVDAVREYQVCKSDVARFANR
jgi:WD40 repeat protein